MRFMALETVHFLEVRKQVFLPQGRVLQIMALRAGRLQGRGPEHGRSKARVRVMATGALAFLHGSMDILEAVHLPVAEIAALRLGALQVLPRVSAVGIVAGSAPALADSGWMDGVMAKQGIVAAEAELLGIVLEQLGDPASVGGMANTAGALPDRPMQHGPGQDLLVARATSRGLSGPDEACGGGSMGRVAGEAEALHDGAVAEGTLGHALVASAAEGIPRLAENGRHGAGMGFMAGEALALDSRGMLALPFDQVLVATEAERGLGGDQQLLLIGFVRPVAVEACPLAEGGVLGFPFDQARMAPEAQFLRIGGQEAFAIRRMGPVADRACAFDHRSVLDARARNGAMASSAQLGHGLHQRHLPPGPGPVTVRAGTA